MANISRGGSCKSSDLRTKKYYGFDCGTREHMYITVFKYVHIEVHTGLEIKVLRLLKYTVIFKRL